MTGLTNVKKGDTVVMLGFTGIRLSEFAVTACDKKTITVETKKGDMTFDRKTGTQQDVEEGKEKYANKIVHPDDAPAKKDKKAAAPAPKKTADKKATKKAAEVEEDDEDDEEEEAPKKSSKKADKKTAPAKGKKKPVEEDDDEDDDEDDYEEV